ncbi:MAG: YlxR family protein [Actinomycetota bacterium]|nr:YlxR family protein [Actinomycetota bacterium]
MRTCIGCRKRTVAAELLRVVVVPGAPDSGPVVVPDPRRRAPGRGAWLHPASECVELAERRRAFARALRVPAATDLTALREYLAKPPGNPTGGTPQEM